MTIAARWPTTAPATCAGRCWALLEAANHATRHPIYRDHYQATKTRLGRQRGPKLARVEVARKLAEAIWHMLTTQAPFHRQGPPHTLWPPDGP